jgi:hypothetical protein
LQVPVKNEALQGNGMENSKRKGKKKRGISMTIKAMTRIQCSFFSFAKLTPTRFYRINGWCEQFCCLVIMVLFMNLRVIYYF